MGTFCVVSEGLDKLCIMGRMHSNGKGISGSSKPFKRTPPSWVKTNARTVTDKVVRLARKGNTPSTIGATLPEDLYYLIKKAVGMRKHLEKNNKDRDQKFRLVLTESRIYRLARYYKRAGKLPPTWKYESSNASTLLA